MSVFSERLRQLRVDSGVTQKEVAAQLDVSMQSYSAYEKGREPNYSLLCAMARYFDVSTDYLLGLAEVTKSSNVGVVEQTGLSPKAVDLLNAAVLDEDSTGMEQDAVSALIEYNAETELLQNLYKYLYGDYAFLDPSDTSPFYHNSKDKRFSTVKAIFKENMRTIHIEKLSSEAVHEVYFSRTIQSLIKMNDTIKKRRK